jgi:NAD(P)-dependent dehydrogenase (short-subunit alcohol dehydrogenase family)
VLPVVLDVAEGAAWAEAADRVERELGPVQVLCNNAGIGQGRIAFNRHFELTDIPERLWQLLFDINVGSVYHGVRTFVPRMQAAGQGGHVVNTASMASFLAPAGLAVYSATKFAVLGLSESLRAELLPHHIGVSVLCPGGVQSNLVARTAAIRQTTPGAQLDSAITAPLSTEPQKMSARSVGERVRLAIEQDEFYILTHPEYGPLLQERFGSILGAVGASAQPGYADTPAMLQRSRNPIYAELAERLGSPA